MNSKLLCVAIVLFSLLVVSTNPALGIWHIPSDPDIGTWDSDSRTYTLDTDVYETIQIDEDGLILDGATHTISGVGTANGVSLSGRTGVTVRNLNINGSGCGVYVNGCSHISVENIFAVDCSTGIVLNLTSESLISGVDVSTNAAEPTGDGIRLSSSSNNTIRNMTATGRWAGINFYTGASGGNTIRQNTLTDCQYGIWAGYNTGSGNRYLNNDLSNCQGASLGIGYDTQFEVTGNNFSDSYGGLWLYDMDGLTLSGEQIDIAVGTVTGAALSLVRVTNAQISGFDLSWEGSGVSGSGLQLNSCSNTTIQNVIATNRNQGIVLTGTSACEISGVDASTTAAEPVGHGIELKSSSNNTIQNVTATGRWAGINFYSGTSSGGNTIRQNTLSGCNWGIWAGHNKGSGNRYLNNDLSNCNASLGIGYDTQFEVAGNNFNGSNGGLLLYDMDGLTLSGEQIDITVGTVTGTGYALYLARVTNAQISGFDLSWTGSGVSGGGLGLNSCSNTTIQNVIATNRNLGIVLTETSACEISGVDASATASEPSGIGIRLTSSSNNTIHDVTATGRWAGIDFYPVTSSGGNTIRQNTLSGCNWGIWAGLNTGSGNRYLNNDLSNCGTSLGIGYDTQFEVAGNNFSGSRGGLGLYDMDGLTLSGGQVDIAVGTVTVSPLYLVRVTNAQISEFDLSWTGSGVSGTGLQLSYCSNVTIQNVTATNRNEGIVLGVTSVCEISGVDVSTTAAEPTGNGIRLVSSSNNTIQDVTATGRWAGINLYNGTSGGNTIRQNTLSDCRYGIWAGYNTGSGNKYLNNDLSNCHAASLGIGFDTQFEVAGNKFSDSRGGLGLYDMDGLTLSGGQVDIAVGTVTVSPLYLVRVTNAQISGFDLSWTGSGVSGTGLQLSYCSNTTIENMTVNNRSIGIQIAGSSNANILTGNTLSNNGHGIRILSSDGNQVYNNKFINNTTQADVSSDSVDNVFNLDKPIGGNFWSNWISPDADHDGFVDVPYVFNYGQDDLPWAVPDGWGCRDPREMIQELADHVQALNLQHGISNSLDAKLAAALQALEDINENNDTAAINTLEAFINAVQAQSDSKIPQADADALIAKAQKIIDCLRRL